MTLVEVCNQAMNSPRETIMFDIEVVCLCMQVGPRFCLNQIKIFGGSFGGPTLYENPFYVAPNQVRFIPMSRDSFFFLPDTVFPMSKDLFYIAEELTS